MAQSLTRLWLHIVFSTKERRPFLRDRGVRLDMHAYLAELCRRLDCLPDRIGGTKDHVHILCLQSTTRPIAELVQKVKARSSKWIKSQGASLDSFQWQSGYGAFSVSHSRRQQVSDYIREQERHHSRLSFRDEFRMLLERNGLEFDENYLWD